jgi:phytoene desaturase
VKLAEESGVKFTYDTKVSEITLAGKKVTGIVTKEEVVVPADIVLSNMDVYFTYTKLLKSKILPTKVIRQERSSSALIFYWGIKKTFPQLDLHNIFFSSNYAEEFDYIWKRKSIYNDPTVYINISSKLKPDDALPNSENWFVMINVPANAGQDWDELIRHSRRNILDKLSRLLETQIEDCIVCEKLLDPRDIEEKTSSYQGSLYGTSSNDKYSAFLRHANFSSKIAGLYFAGGSVHPGGGIPLALLSAKIACNLVP